MGGKLRVALAAGPMIPVPPPRYGGTERVVAALGEELHRRGHRVTIFASGDSKVPFEFVSVLPVALGLDRAETDPTPYIGATARRVLELRHRFDIIHSHLDTSGVELARRSSTPVVTTMHGRLDLLDARAARDELAGMPLVAISEAQRRSQPDLSWVATIHHGLPLAKMPFGDRPGRYLLFVGRLTREKGVKEAIDLARVVGMPLLMAAKVRHSDELKVFERVIRPALREGTVTYLGELGPERRDPLLAGAFATLMLGAWPEPFGLVAIESLAAGTR